jgi:predicted amidohydrolase YtcJ
MADASGAAQQAEVVSVSGAVYQVNAARSRAQAVAISGDKILAVDADEDVRPLIGSSTTVLNRNLFDHPAPEIGHAQVDLTMAGGRIVYARPGAGE